MDILEYGKEQLVERNLNLLILKEDKEIVFQSNKMGILPMYEFFRLNVEEEVYVIDKFIGLGASRLLLNSKSKVMGLFTFVISKDAKELLKGAVLLIAKRAGVLLLMFLCLPASLRLLLTARLKVLLPLL